MKQVKPPKISVFSVLIILAVITLLGVALQYPLLGSLGPEAGILFGVAIGPLAYFGGCIRGAYRDFRGYAQDLTHELCVGAIAISLFVVVLTLNSFWVASCAPSRGILPFFIHAVPVFGINSAAGIFLGRLVGRRLWAFAAALALILLYIGYQTITWWRNPSFKILSHPFLALDGDLISGAGLSFEIIGFRAATLFFAFAVVFLGIALFRSAQSMSFIKERDLRLGTIFPVIVFVLLGAITHFSVLETLAPSKDSRIKVLSRESQRGIFILHTDPKNTSEEQAEAVLAEAYLWGNRLKERIGDASSENIHIWLYPNSKSLRRFTGAANVHFALPRHREIHITSASVPHPTLGHEIAHVIIGEKTSTQLGVPGAFAILQNVGLTEGLAVMLTPELSIRDDLVLKEQAAALAQAGKLPNLNQLFSLSPLGFFDHNLGASYSVAGAFLEHLIDLKASSLEQRQQLIALLAKEGSLESVFGSEQEREQIQENYLKDLLAFELPKDAKATIDAIFSSASVLSSQCPNEALQETLVTDPLKKAERIALIANNMDYKCARKRQMLLEEAGDLFWKANRPKDAAEQWDKVTISCLPPSLQRTPLAKQLLADSLQSEISVLSLDYLVWANAGGSKTVSATMNLAAQVQVDSSAPLANYLALRQRLLASGKSHDIAALRNVSAAPGLPQIFQTESMKLIAWVNALFHRNNKASEQFSEIANQSVRAAERLQMLDFAERSRLIATASGLEKDNPQSGDLYLLGIQNL